MKKLLILSLVLVAFTACKEETTKHPDYKITFEAKKVTLDNEGKATTSCTVFPADLDISKLTLLSSIDGVYQKTSDDMSWGGVDITTVTKDPSVKGKWNVSFAPTADSKPYVLKPEYSYFLNADVYCMIQVQSDGGYPVNSNAFVLSLDVKPVVAE